MSIYVIIQQSWEDWSDETYTKLLGYVHDVDEAQKMVDKLELKHTTQTELVNELIPVYEKWYNDNSDNYIFPDYPDGEHDPFSEAYVHQMEQFEIDHEETDVRLHTDWEVVYNEWCDQKGISNELIDTQYRMGNNNCSYFDRHVSYSFEEIHFLE